MAVDNYKNDCSKFCESNLPKAKIDLHANEKQLAQRAKTERGVLKGGFLCILGLYQEQIQQLFVLSVEIGVIIILTIWFLICKYWLKK